MQSLIAQSEIKPMVNQIEYHPPLLQQPELKQYLDAQGIQAEAWSPPLGGTGGNLMQNPIIGDIALKHHKSPAQVLIRWDLQNSYVTIPKSVHPEYIQANADVFDFELDSDDLCQLKALDQHLRTSYWLTTFDWYTGNEQ